MCCNKDSAVCTEFGSLTDCLATDGLPAWAVITIILVFALCVAAGIFVAVKMRNARRDMHAVVESERTYN